MTRKNQKNLPEQSGDRQYIIKYYQSDINGRAGAVALAAGVREKSGSEIYEKIKLYSRGLFFLSFSSPFRFFFRF